MGKAFTNYYRQRRREARDYALGRKVDVRIPVPPPPPVQRPVAQGSGLIVRPTLAQTALALGLVGGPHVKPRSDSSG